MFEKEPKSSLSWSQSHQEKISHPHIWLVSSVHVTKCTAKQALVVVGAAAVQSLSQKPFLQNPLLAELRSPSNPSQGARGILNTLLATLGILEGSGRCENLLEDKTGRKGVSPSQPSGLSALSSPVHLGCA